MSFKKKIKIFISKVYPDFFVKSNSFTLSKTRIFSGKFRINPDFIIIGAQKCGTTSLYDYICKHSDVYPAVTKQIQYFNINYLMKIEWYRSFFPLIFKKFIIEKILRKSFLTGEATPDYINHPYVPIRISNDLPNVKLIAIFRNPVERAFSNYQHNIRDKTENLSFEDALKQEKSRIEIEKTKLKKDEFYHNENFLQFEYVERGIYVNQIINWLKYFSKDKILIISTEDLEQHSSKTLTEVFSFLNLKSEKIDTSTKLNVGTYSNMKDKTRDLLYNLFLPYNEQLYKLIKKRFDW
jgi:hypothetical protein